MASETPREIAKRCMPHVKYEHLDDILYQKWTSPCTPSETYKKLSQIEFTPKDVYCTGWPRSGNHRTYYAVDMILKQSATPTTKSLPESFLEFMSDEQLNDFKVTPSPRLFCSHARLRRFPDIAKKNAHVIYVIRNPKDAMVSFYKLLRDFIEEHQFSGTWDDYFEASLGGELVWGTWFDHVLDLEKFMADNPNVPVYIHQFEEMKQKPVECVKKLCAFLGQPDTLAEKIAASSSFDKISTVVVKAHTNEHYLKVKDKTLLTTGGSGSWKNYFTVAQSERFDREFEKKMKDSKLAKLVRQYL